MFYMFYRPGRVLKYFATVLAILGGIAGTIILIIGFRYDDTLLIIVGISLIPSAWFIGLLLYAFGELVENTTLLREHFIIRTKIKESRKSKKLKEMLRLDLITEQDYFEALEEGETNYDEE